MAALSGLRRLVLLLLMISSPAQAAISFTTLNIRFYGLYSEEDQRDQEGETRDATINAYLDANALRTDVMVFQEIVDVDRLKRNIVGFGYSCFTYSSRQSKHQYVVVCHKPKLRFEKAADDDDYILEDVALEKYRPAVHGILSDARTGAKIAHLVAVHLKAMPEDSAMRMEQVGLIRDYLAYEREDSLPVVLVGDSNLFPEDVPRVDELLADSTLRMTQVQTPGNYSYRVPTFGQKFDRFWITRGLTVEGTPRIVGPCNAEGPSAENQIKAHNRDVSDHCAVTLKLRSGSR